MHTAITTPAAFLTYTTTYVPLIVPALLIALRGTAAIGWRWWALTGLLFGIATPIMWDHPLTFGGALLAAPLMVLGARRRRADLAGR